MLQETMGQEQLYVCQRVRGKQGEGVRLYFDWFWLVLGRLSIIIRENKGEARVARVAWEAREE